MRDLRGYRVQRSNFGNRSSKLLGAVIVALGTLGALSFASHQTVPNEAELRSPAAPAPVSSLAVRTTPDAGQPSQVPPPVAQE